jgi:AcrR family transcriptional regulator
MPRQKSPHSRPQLRGVRRRGQLLRAAAELIVHLPLAELTYAAVCARARIPPSSAYHFYANLDEICHALLVVDQAGLNDALMRPMSAVQSRTWQSVVKCLVDRAASYNRSHPVAAKLAIGGQTPPHLKHVDREADRVRSRLAIRALEELFVLPPLPLKDQIAFLAIEIIDTAFTASMIECGRLTPGYVMLAKAAAIGFLTQFLGEQVPRRGKSAAPRVSARKRATRRLDPQPVRR